MGLTEYHDIFYGVFIPSAQFLTSKNLIRLLILIHIVITKLHISPLSI